MIIIFSYMYWRRQVGTSTKGIRKWRLFMRLACYEGSAASTCMYLRVSHLISTGNDMVLIHRGTNFHAFLSVFESQAICCSDRNMKASRFGCRETIVLYNTTCLWIHNVNDRLCTKCESQQGCTLSMLYSLKIYYLHFCRASMVVVFWSGSTVPCLCDGDVISPLLLPSPQWWNVDKRWRICSSLIASLPVAFLDFC